jgi:ADP-L-glycero-D-manno-heptose 6-epimerase
MTIAITGAAGFIGANLARRLADQGERDLLLVDYPLTRPKAANFAALPSFRFVEHLDFLDLLERDAVEVEALFHLGACSDTTERDWDYLTRNNIVYTQRLWDWCARHGSSFIYASSAATYGDGSRGFDDATPPDQLEPLNLYGKSKNDFDRWVVARLNEGAPAPKGWAGLKFFNVYGPREHHKGRMASMVWHSYQQIRERGEVGLFRSDVPDLPDGGQRRDFVAVEDCVEHMLWLRRHPEASGLYNSGTGAARTFRALVEATFAALDQAPKIRYIEMPKDLRGRYQSYTQATMTKLREAGYPGAPTALEVGVRRYVDWLEGKSVGLREAPDAG